VPPGDEPVGAHENAAVAGELPMALPAAAWVIRVAIEVADPHHVRAGCPSQRRSAGTVRLCRQRKSEFLLSIATLLSVAMLGVLSGIVIAVALSILNVFRRAWWPYKTVLGRVEGLEGYHDVHMHPDARQLPGLVIYRFDAPLFFANVKTFRDKVRHLARAEPKPHWIVIAAEPVTDMDTTASDVLEDLDSALAAQGISLVFAEMKDPVRQKIERYGLAHQIEKRHFFPTIGAAVTGYGQQTGTQWSPSAGTPSPDGQPPPAAG
jgi:MFS superfamily sulfate permease-like transporter